MEARERQSAHVLIAVSACVFADESHRSSPPYCSVHALSLICVFYYFLLSFHFVYRVIVLYNLGRGGRGAPGFFSPLFHFTTSLINNCGGVILSERGYVALDHLKASIASKDFVQGV